ncbi:autotransporter outer membrane beta-barrel domain-containing protein [Stenotrophomonas maltophilia]|nr:autotransporter outer membrane beta-barrel domain-containing protein [Stenotrophomonas pavanii]MBH1389265.1 autotransporter outer membrane beta-barrel domain-containing protein [Stenotrophomonas maltophilia]UGB15854.1 autotransporter outer membrane beta-barrel domain-containing protein [Stenotrophomonas maltophilia]UGB50732.1 autotransporter outer membrane beta-barrel domain-containing protein [Stenotrophomonas maltophilia]
MRVQSFSAATPSLRPLARCLLLALTMPMGAAWAGDLDGGTAEVVAGDPVEQWRVRNGGALTINGGEANQISASEDSRVTLNNAVITRDPSVSGEYYNVSLQDDASLEAVGTLFQGGGITLSNGSATARLVNSSINIPGGEAGRQLSVGLDLFHNPTVPATPIDPRGVLDRTHVRVGDAPDASRDSSSGIGVRMGFGTVDIVNGSFIDADNVGVLFLGSVGPFDNTLRVDASTINSRRGAALRVAPRREDQRYDITIANDSHVTGGDGNLLLVQAYEATPSTATPEVHFTVDDSRLAGDITYDRTSVPNGTLDVILRNKAQIDGRFINVTSASIDSDSTWLMTGDSNVGHLALGNTGTVALGNGSTFNTLTVDTFDGAGGTLLFNTQLGDDSSATDRLIIKGDANGKANVRVLNAGGAGAKTDKGIELIRVGGASNAQFDLQGRAVGGQYEYFLFKDATNGGWYLRSELAGTPDPCVVDPTLPECTPIDPVDPVDPIGPTPVLRPEAGAYLANQFAMDQMLRHGWRDRQGGNTSAVDGVRGWARVDGAQSKLSAVEDQLDLRVDRSRLQLGADIGVFDNGQGRVGVMGTLAKSDATSRSQLTGYSARGKVNGGALGVYGNWSNDALYVDASVQRGQFRNRVQGEGLAEERYDSDIWQSSLEAGYRIGIGQIGRTALNLQPELQLVYTDANTDRHEEANGTVVRSLGDSGLSGRVGLRLQGESRSAAGASVSPYVVANWYRDRASNGMAFDDEALKASVPRNRYELNAGARVDFRSGLSAWGGFGVMRGDHGYREATANLSMSYKW